MARGRRPYLVTCDLEIQKIDEEITEAYDKIEELKKQKEEIINQKRIKTLEKIENRIKSSGKSIEEFFEDLNTGD